MSDLIVVPYSASIFKDTAPGYGQALLLFSGSANVDLASDKGWETEGKLQRKSDGLFKAGETYSLIGMTVRCQDVNGASNNINLRVCDQISIYFNNEILNCNVGNRTVLTSYAYFDVFENASLNKIGKSVVFNQDISASFYRVKVGEDKYKFVDYECNLGNTVEGNVVTLYPTFGLAYENSDYNPVFNNVTASVYSSYTREVETYREVATGSSAKAHYSCSVDKVTTLAEIADSFYTSLQNISGRFLGAKNCLITTYRGNKWEFSEENLTASMATVLNPETGEPEHNDKIKRKDLPFFHLQGFTGSIYPVGTEDAALKAMNVSEMVLENLLYTTTASYTGSCIWSRGFVNRSRVDVPHVTLTELYTGSVPPSSSSSGSKGEIWVVENNLPRIGSILYRISASVERLTNVKVYSPDLGAALKTDDYGIVTDILEVQSLQTT